RSRRGVAARAGHCRVRRGGNRNVARGFHRSRVVRGYSAFCRPPNSATVGRARSRDARGGPAMKRLFLLVVLSASAACTLGPDYNRPAVAMPPAHRDTVDGNVQSDAMSLADTQWFDLFRDDSLTQLVRTALAQNF